MNTKKQWKQYWFVIRELTSRELKRKYSRSKLGILWSVLQPLLNMVVLTFIFSYMFRRSIDNYPVYYLCGNVMLSLFSGGTGAGLSALEDNKGYLVKLKIPMRVFVISRVYTALVNFCYSLLAFIPILLVFRIRPGWSILMLPVLVALLTMFVMGISYMLSVACVFFGDIKHLWGIFMTLVMFMSAIFYPVDRLHGISKTIVEHNPMYIFINCFRKVMYLHQMPDGSELSTLLLWTAAMYVIGLQVFHKNKNKIVQKI